MENFARTFTRKPAKTSSNAAQATVVKRVASAPVTTGKNVLTNVSDGPSATSIDGVSLLDVSVPSAAQTARIPPPLPIRNSLQGRTSSMPSSMIPEAPVQGSVIYTEIDQEGHGFDYHIVARSSSNV